VACGRGQPNQEKDESDKVRADSVLARIWNRAEIVAAKSPPPESPGVGRPRGGGNSENNKYQDEQRLLERKGDRRFPFLIIPTILTAHQLEETFEGPISPPHTGPAEPGPPVALMQGRRR